MKGAAKRAENRRAEIWWAAMLPHLKSPPDYVEFVTGEKDRRAELLKCLDAWDRVDRALMRRH